ncbi:MAG: GTP-binding protein [Paracoccaceae bacterium]|nr:GTP-binding protein [Paracoccaceae bacterium]
MTETTEGRLRLTILGGFLGSGKTTWLRHQLHTGAFGRVHVIVNEAADAPVDDALLQAADQMTLLSGACVCCTGRDQLRDALLSLCDVRSRRADHDTRLENIVLETSGLADPGAILSVIQADPILVRQIVVAETIVIVDALNALQQMQQETLSRRQIEAADRLILTKTDISGSTDTAGLRATLRALAPGATQSAASFGSDMPLPALASQQKPLALPDLADDDSAPIIATRLTLGPTPDWTAFTVWLSALLHARGDQIVRVKGVVRTPAGRLLLQTVRRSVQSPEILPEPDVPCDTDNTIAVIGRGFTQDQLAASLARVSA